MVLRVCPNMCNTEYKLCVLCGELKGIIAVIADVAMIAEKMCT